MQPPVTTIRLEASFFTGSGGSVPGVVFVGALKVRVYVVLCS